VKLAHASRAVRQTADERREAILDAAIVEFALYGLHGTATEAIARRVGISQPYVFRLFGTKKELFLAALERVHERILALFLDAAAGAPEGEKLKAMGRSYDALLARRHEVFFLLQSFAASSDPEVQSVARERYATLYRQVEAASGAEKEVLRQFFAKGMLDTIAAALDLPLLLDSGDEICAAF